MLSVLRNCSINEASLELLIQIPLIKVILSLICYKKKKKNKYILKNFLSGLLIYNFFCGGFLFCFLDNHFPNALNNNNNTVKIKRKIKKKAFKINVKCKRNLKNCLINIFSLLWRAWLCVKIFLFDFYAICDEKFDGIFFWLFFLYKIFIHFFWFLDVVQCNGAIILIYVFWFLFLCFYFYCNFKQLFWI